MTHTFVTASARQRTVAFCSALLLTTSAAVGAESLPLQDRAVATAAEYLRGPLVAVGVSAVDLRTHRPLIEMDAHELFAPASNQKLLTAAFALERLGANFAFTTAVYKVGEDIVIAGDGDPILGDPYLAEQSGGSIYDELDRWAQAVKQAFGEAVVGDILLCRQRDPRAYRHEDWPPKQHSRWYAAPVASLNFNDNCLDIGLSVDGRRVAPLVSPRTRWMTIKCTIRTGPKQRWSASLEKDDSLLILKGTARQNTSEPISVAVNDPLLLLGRVFADRLERVGVNLQGRVRTVTLDACRRPGAQLLSRTTAPLTTVLARANKRSLNLAAECVLLRSGDGTWAGSAAAMEKVLIESFGLSPGAVIVRDGSGLSAKNRVSPAAMTRVLSEMVRRPDSAVLLASLPIAGTDGTLQRRMAQPPVRGRVAAKTGYIAGASCLSGYALDTRGRPAIAFSILTRPKPGKAWQAKRLQDAICLELVRWVDENAVAEISTGSQGQAGP